jgi:hypothetical protein
MKRSHCELRSWLADRLRRNAHRMAGDELSFAQVPAVTWFTPPGSLHFNGERTST